eukprot:3480569-Amphidinium_carterae.1
MHCDRLGVAVLNKGVGCNTIIAQSAGGRHRPQLAGRANSTAPARKQRHGPKIRVCKRLRSEHGQRATLLLNLTQHLDACHSI